MTKAAIPLLLAAIAAGAETFPLNGGFEQADPADPRKPLGWDLPDGLGVQWLTAPGQGHGKAICLNTKISEQDMVAQWKKMAITQWDIPSPAKNAIAETYGLSLYSAAFPCEKGRPYRVRWSFIGAPGGVKVWVRGYKPDDDTGRRVYEAVSNGDSHLAGAAEDWRQVEHCFHPTKNTPGVTSLKVMLFAFYPARAYWFDDLKVEPISDAEYADYRAKAGK